MYTDRSLPKVAAPKAPVHLKRSSAQRFADLINAGARVDTVTEGVIAYTKFSMRETHNPMLVYLSPYGHYTFTDGSVAALTDAEGSLYAYLP